MSESLRQEIEPLGLKCICIEPGYFRTEFLQPGNRTGTASKGYDDYKEIREKAVAGVEGMCLPTLSHIGTMLSTLYHAQL